MERGRRDGDGDWRLERLISHFSEEAGTGKGRYGYYVINGDRQIHAILYTYEDL